MTMTGAQEFDPIGDAPIADIEVALMEYLAPAGRTVTQLMNMDSLPIIRIQRIGGGEGSEDDATDLPRVLINCYASPTAADDPRASLRVAADVHRRMKAIHGVWIDGLTLDSATKDSGPVTRPWDDPTIRVTELIYSVTARI